MLEEIKKENRTVENPNNTINPILEFIFNLNKIGAGITSFLEEKRESINSFILSSAQIINAIGDDISKTVHSPVFQDFAKNLVFYIANSNNILENYNEAAELLDKYHWFIPDSIDFFEFQENIISLVISENVTQQDIDNKFLEFYFGNNFEKLEMVVNKLKNNMEEDRYLIINDCFNLLKSDFEKKDYNYLNLIIPTLIIHIDRYRLDTEETFLKVNNIKLKNGEKPKEFFLNKIKCNEKMIDLSIEFLIEKLFRDSKKINEEIKNGQSLTDEKLYRNKIMHGEQLNYGTLKNALKCFLILEYINNLHNEIKKGTFILL